MKKKLSVLLVLVLAVAISAYSVGGTYAKYTSTFTGTTSTARVAKWAFKVNDTAVTTAFDFDLFATINEADTTTAETDVASNSTDTVIAPGTGGSFSIALANESEVNATYTVDYTITNTAGIPIEFSIDNGTTWTTGLSDIETPVAINKGASANVVIKWRWAYTGSASANYTSAQTDATDTALGATGTDTVSVQATIVATQAD